jgi:hypothetical protein
LTYIAGGDVCPEADEALEENISRCWIEKALAGWLLYILVVRY